MEVKIALLVIYQNLAAIEALEEDLAAQRLLDVLLKGSLERSSSHLGVVPCFNQLIESGAGKFNFDGCAVQLE